MPRKTKVRIHGEGTVYEERSPGRPVRYIAQIYIDGKKVRRSANTRQEALTKLRELQDEQSMGKNLHAQQPTVAQWRATCQSTYLGHLRPNVRADYDSVGRNHIDSSSIGKIRLDKLTRPACQKWINDLAATGRAYNTVRNARAVLHEILAIAHTQGYITRNPAERLKIPIAKPSEDDRATEHAWTHDEVRAFFDVIKGHRLEALFYLALTIGARQGELLGLVWPAIDFKKGTVSIRKQLRRLPGEDGVYSWQLQPVKTTSGRRTLMLDKRGIELLKERRETQAEELQLPGIAEHDPFRGVGGLVFTSEVGGPIYGRGLIDMFVRMVKKAGIPPIRFHDLRHTCASLMLADGEPLTTVSAILGHRSPVITATIYAHAIRGQTDEAIARHAQRLRRDA